MKKLLFLFWTIATFTSCTSDGGSINPDGKLVAESKRKSAISAFNSGGNNSQTGKMSETRKRLVKSITFVDSYKTWLTAEEYAALPTDNVYDTIEDALNLDTRKYIERIYEYNSDGNLSKITINNIFHPENNSLPEYQPMVYNYNSEGKNQISNYQDRGSMMYFEYNAIGQIVKAFDINGDLLNTYSYDEVGNLSCKIFYYQSDKGPMPHWKSTYVYYPDNTYEMNEISLKNGVEVLLQNHKYSYNKNVAGVYTNEALFKATSDSVEGLQYLHITSNSGGHRPKYFYDKDGYLIKYDSTGRNFPEDTTIFIYE